MGLLWWLSFVACMSCCILSKAEDYEEQLADAPTKECIRPCMDESCRSESVGPNSDEMMWHFLSLSIRAYKESHQVHETELSDPDDVVQYCLPLHKSTVDRISLMETLQPKLKDVQMEVLKDFIRYLSDFVIFNTTRCDSRISLLAYTKWAFRSLQAEYDQQCGEHCECVYSLGVKEYMATSSTDSPQTSESMDQITSTYPPMGDEGYRTPCPEDSDHDSYEEIYAEDQDHSHGSSMLVGSVGGVPGVDFPNYKDIPLTSFSCADKQYIPGFYADLETNCQVFHVCYEHRRESFLCPLGTIFNQAILACDYWYSSNCSLAQDYYEVNEKSQEEIKEEIIEEIIEDEETEVAEEHSESTDEVYEEVDSKQVAKDHGESTDEVQAGIDIRQFLPVKAKVIDFEKPVVKFEESVAVNKQDVQEVASQIFNKIVTTASDIASKARVAIGQVPEPDEIELKPGSSGFGTFKLKQILSAKKAADVKIAVPASKVAAVKTAIPVAKVVAAKKVTPLAAKVAAVPVAKIAAAKAIPIAAKATVKTSVPVVAAKLVPLKAKAAVAAAVPKVKIAAVKTAFPVAAKVAAFKSTVPVAAKASAVKSAIPVATKAKLFSVPVKKVAISGVKSAGVVPKLKVPLLKTKVLAPAMKGKVLKTATVPLLKAKILPVKGSLAGLAPVAKAKLVKTAAISPLTKKTLALGYMKLLKAKKLALMG